MPEKTRSYQDILFKLRREIKKNGVDAYLIPRTDAFQGEFIAPYAERLLWLTGFSGSAGVGIVLMDKAVVMSDGRYTIQLREQVDQALYDLQDSTKISVGEWLSLYAGEGAKIGFDPWLHTPQAIEETREIIKEKNMTLVPLETNLIDLIWEEQPEKPSVPVSLFPDSVAGKTVSQKLMQCAERIKANGAQTCLLSAGDSICWLLNVRGGDVPFSPLCLSYLLLHADGSADWFIDEKQVPGDVCKALPENVRVLAPKEIKNRMESFTGAVQLDRKTVPVWFEGIAQAKGINVINAPDPCIMPQAIKSASEQEAIRKAHILDGVAVTRFLKWIDEHQNVIPMSELSVEQALEEYRRMHPDYLGPSFATIAGFGAHGAVVHYRATEKTELLVKGNGLLLVDSGGQYRWGTTDITRTIAIGTPTQEMKAHYTRVLKGHIAVASAVFPQDTPGKEIDARARTFLHEAGLDYAHGTGHGVGCCLSVHEKATHISPREEKPFEAGMLISNEPGYYREGEYGIRIENLVLVQDGPQAGQLCFETVSFAPFDPKLIAYDMLDAQEKDWLLSYLSCMYENLAPHMTRDEQEWLALCIGKHKTW